jgi:hypothetical protein
MVHNRLLIVYAIDIGHISTNKCFFFLITKFSPNLPDLLYACTSTIALLFFSNKLFFKIFSSFYLLIYIWFIRLRDYSQSWLGTSKNIIRYSLFILSTILHEARHSCLDRLASNIETFLFLFFWLTYSMFCLYANGGSWSDGRVPYVCFSYTTYRLIETKFIVIYCKLCLCTICKKKYSTIILHCNKLLIKNWSSSFTSK